MWMLSVSLSIGAVLLSIAAALVLNRTEATRGKISTINILLVGVFFSSLVLFLPANGQSDGAMMQGWRVLLLSILDAMKVFGGGGEYGAIAGSLENCSTLQRGIFLTWAVTLFVYAPVLTFSFVLSLFRNLSAFCRYALAMCKDVYIFSELNDQALALADDLKKNHKKAAVAFTGVSEGGDEKAGQRIENAKKMGAICFKKPILAIAFRFHAPAKKITFFTIGRDETENQEQALKLIEKYRDRANTHLYVFTTKVDGQLLLADIDKGCMKVRRVNPVQSLIHSLLYEHGQSIFEQAVPAADGVKDITAVVVGMGGHGTEMVKALAWFGQMDGYRITIHAFDKDPLAEEKFTALAPELMSPDYNGVSVEGEAQYTIAIHSGMDVSTATFAKTVSALKGASYVLVALGDDDENVGTAVNLRMLFERIGAHPAIQAIVYNSTQKNALAGIRNYRGQPYNIEFIGDMESIFAEKVILESQMEARALERHLKWGEEEEFWTYEYNYRSSVATAIHMKARILCGIPGAAKAEEDLTEAERDIIEVLEHRRWNAYMRSEGYVFSGSTDKSSRNDLAKMHHDLVDFSALSEEEKRKDSAVGTY